MEFIPKHSLKSLFLSALAFITLCGLLSLFAHFRQPESSSLFISSQTGKWTISEEGTKQLQISAERYLEETAQILGSRFNAGFYTAAVHEKWEHLANFPKEITCRNYSGHEAELLATFGSDTAEDSESLLEALSFLNEIESDSPPVPAFCQTIYLSGSPLNAVAEQLAGIPASQIPPREYAAEYICGKIIPITELCGILFSLLSVAVSFAAEESWLSRLFGVKNLRLIFTIIQMILSPLLYHPANRKNLSLFVSFPSLFPRHHIDERKITVLLC